VPSIVADLGAIASPSPPRIGTRGAFGLLLQSQADRSDDADAA
jgi:hypothetical protein